ncbi:MAG: BatD family protein [Verrucomicrobiota bacterium]
MRFYISKFIVLVALAASAQAEVTVQTFFEPSRVKLDDKARYIIRLEETDTKGLPKLEPIEDLSLTENIGGLRLADGRLRRGSSRQISINGAKTYSDSFDVVIDVIPSRIGTFIIPEHSFTYKGERYTAPAASLTVVEQTAPEHPPTEHNVRLLVDAPERLYAGQTTNIAVKLYIYSGLDYVQYSQLNSSAPDFVYKADDSQAYETTEFLQGWQYKVVNWPVEITPIKSGELSLEFEVIVSQTTGFGFFSRNRERFPVYSEPTLITVDSLPQTGQPDSFTGAIGNFTIEVFSDQNEAQEGEPIMLSLTVRGTGNFERIAGPEFPTLEEWRNYSPEWVFEPNEDIPLSGSKRFDYIFIPQESGSLELPEVSFAYFDPEFEKYVELSSPPIPVEVTPSTTSSFVSSIPQRIEDENQLELKRMLTSEEALLMLDYQPRKANPIRPTILSHPLFYTTNSIALCALVGSTVICLRRRKLLNDEDYARSKAAADSLKQCIKDLDTAQRQNEPVEFYKTAQNAIRLGATKRTGKEFSTASANDLKRCFQNLGFSDETVEASDLIFSHANAALYSDKPGKIDLGGDRAIIDSILKAL